MAIVFTPADGDGIDYLAKTSPTITSTPITFALWFYDLSDRDTGVAVSVGDSSNLNNYHSLTISRSQVWAQSRGGGSAQKSSVSGVTINQWEHAAGIFASSTSRTVFLNGIAGTTNTTSVSPTGIDLLRIGAISTSAASPIGFDGYIAEVAIWDIALSVGDIQALAGGASPPLIRPNNLVSYYPLIRDYIDQFGNNEVTPNNAVNWTDHPPVFEGTGNTLRSAWGGI